MTQMTKAGRDIGCNLKNSMKHQCGVMSKKKAKALALEAAAAAHRHGAGGEVMSMWRQPKMLSVSVAAKSDVGDMSGMK